MQTMVDQAEIHRKALSDYVEKRQDAAWLLRDNFADLPDKDAAWEDLHRLTGDEDSYVRAFANHSLGRASAFRATEAESEDDF